MLKLVQVVVELLEALDEGDEAGSNTRVGIDSCLDDPLLVEKRLQTERELYELEQEAGGTWWSYFGFLVEVKDIDFLNFTLLEPKSDYWDVRSVDADPPSERKKLLCSHEVQLEKLYEAIHLER